MPLGIAIRFNEPGINGKLHLIATAKRSGNVEGSGYTDATIVAGKHTSANIELQATAVGPGSDGGIGGGVDSGIGDGGTGGGADSGTQMDGGTPACIGGCMLAAMEAQIAVVGDALTLEGSFGNPMTVNFGGGVHATASLLGNTRATVTVPTGAITGPVSVTIGSQTVGALPLRIATFTPGIDGNFEPTFDQVEGARATPLLSNPRQGTAAVVVGPYLYVVAGGSSTSLTSIERSTVNADGSIGAFGLIGGVTLTTGRSNHAVVVLGNYLYVLGGQGADGKAITSVERAPIGSDSTLGSFETAGSLGTSRSQFATVVIGNRLYAIGGVDSMGNVLNTVESAAIGADGGLSAFSPATSTLVTARTGHTAQVIGNALFVLAGSSGDVEQAPIGADGSLGAFTKMSTAPLAQSVTQAASIVFGGNVYILGGTNGSGLSSTVQKASASGGAVGTFSDMSNTTYLTSPRSGFAAVIVGNYLYAIGGLSLVNNVQAASNTVERVSINLSAGLSAFQQVTANVLKTPRYGHTATVLGNHLYVIGGYSSGALGTVEQATIQPDGTLGAFSTMTSTALVTPREYHTTAVVGSYLYVIGGDPGTGAQNLPVERASIGSDGTISTFSNFTTTTVAHTGHTSEFVAGKLYIFDDTQSEAATVSDNVGNISSFGNVTGLTTNPNQRSGAVLEQLVYSFGGYDASSPPFTAQKATWANNGTVGNFVTVDGLSGPPSFGSAIDIIGNRLLALGGTNAGSTYFSDVYAAPIARDGTLMNFTALTGSPLANQRAWSTTTVVGNYVWVVGGQTKSGGSVVPLGITEQSQLR